MCKSWKQLSYSVNLLIVLKTHRKAGFRSLKHWICKTYWTQLGCMVNMLIILKTSRKPCFCSVKHCTCKTHWTQIGHMVHILIVLKTHRKAGFCCRFGTLFHAILYKISVLQTHWKTCFHGVKHCKFKTKWTQRVYMVTMLTLKKTHRNASFRTVKHCTWKTNWT